MKELEELGIHREGHYSAEYRGFVLSCEMYYSSSNWYCVYEKRYLVRNTDGLIKLKKNGTKEYPIITAPQEELVIIIDTVLESYPELFI